MKIYLNAQFVSWITLLKNLYYKDNIFKTFRNFRKSINKFFANENDKFIKM